MVTQRIRVSFFDPDATDSDSGDDSSNDKRVPGKKAGTKEEMIILVTTSTNNSNPIHPSRIVESASEPPLKLPKMRGAKVVRSTPNRWFRGVYERQPGRWVADFRNHRLKVRRWIGTFTSEEEAKAAYDAFQAQFSLGGSVEAVTQNWVVPVAMPTRSIVLDESDQSEIGLNHQADDLSTVSSAAPHMFSLVSSPPPAAAVMSHKPPQHADERQIEDQFLAEDLTHDDLADLPLPSLDDKLDFRSVEWALLNIDVPVICKNECNPGA